MAWAIAKVVIAGLVISFSSWLANHKPALAGFIIALPLATLLALLFNYSEFSNTEKSAQFAKSIFISIPLSMSFFIPFLFADRFKIGFWGLYSSGIVLLILAYFLHRFILEKMAS